MHRKMKNIVGPVTAKSRVLASLMSFVALLATVLAPNNSTLVSAEIDVHQVSGLLQPTVNLGVYTDPLYGYQLYMPQSWRVLPTPPNVLYGAAVFSNYELQIDRDSHEGVGKDAPANAIKMQIGIAPLPAGQTMEDWAAKWMEFETDSEPVRSHGLSATVPEKVRVGTFEGLKYTISDMHPHRVLVLNLRVSAGQVMVVGITPANSTSLSEAMLMLGQARIDEDHHFPPEVMALANQSANAPVPPRSGDEALGPDAPAGTCPAGTFPGTEAPNSPIQLWMPFRNGETWTVGGAGAFYGNIYHCNSNDDYYATDWGRGGPTNGSAVLPVADGTISGVQVPSCPTTGYGCWVQVDHASSIRTLYGHLSGVSRTSGGVSHTDQIGIVGSTGNSTGPHLHLRFAQNNGGYHSRCNRPGGCPNGEAAFSPQGPKPSPMQTTSGSRDLIDGASYTSNNGGTQPPSAPSLQSPPDGATFNEGESITISWSATGSEYFGEITGGPGGTLTFGWQSGTSVNIGSQWAGYVYTVRVKARNSAGESGWSNSRSFTVRPATPSNLSAQSAGCNEIHLTWQDNSGNEEGYKVYRNGELRAQLGANSNSYTDSNVSGSSSYSYYVKAFRSSIESDSSNTANGNTPPCPTNTPVPTPTFTNTPIPMPTDTNTPIPTSTDTSLPKSTPTVLPTSTSTIEPTQTETPQGTALPTSTAISAHTATATSIAATATGTVTVPNTATSVAQPPTSTVIPVTGTATQTTGTVVATSTPTPPSTCLINFVDVPITNTFYPFVRCLACRGIDTGYSCGGTGEPCNASDDPYFRPDSLIKRDDMAHMVAASAGFSEDPGARRFQDVPPTNTYYAWVQRMANRGLIGGYPCGGTGEPCVAPNNLAYYRPNANATRGQIAKIVSNGAGFSEPPSGQMFEDVGPDQAFYEWVQRLADRGVMGGYPCGGPSEPCDTSNRPYFRWGNNSTRGQVAKITTNTFFPACQTP